MVAVLVSVRWTEEHLGHIVLKYGISDDTREESSDIVTDQEQVADEFPFVVVEIHVVVHVGLAVGEEREVSVVRTLLAPDPHEPHEHDVEVRHEVKVNVRDPHNHIECLEDCGHVRSFQGDRLKGRQGEHRAQVVRKRQHNVLLKSANQTNED